MLDWLIIGGGIHGTYLANLLIHQIGVDPERLRILDPQPQLLNTWRRNTANSGMRYLRSPATHQIDLPILSLYRFAKLLPDEPSPRFIPPYNRPSLSLFQTHCTHVINSNRLDRLHVVGRAHASTRKASSHIVTTSAGEFQTRNILLAIGLGEQPLWPAWAKKGRCEDDRIQHVFDPGFDRRKLTSGLKTVITGGGITAVQLALRLASTSPADVVILSPHRLRESFYDFDPCWIGPKCLSDFYPLSAAQRREAIDGARVTGSLPPEVMNELNTALAAEKLALHRGQVVAVEQAAGRLQLKTESNGLQADRVILATGLESHRPGGAFIDQLIDEYDLSCNDCGYPLVDESLQWAEQLFVTGPLAELQLGPCARNIIGARNAGRLLTDHFSLSPK